MKLEKQKWNQTTERMDKSEGGLKFQSLLIRILNHSYPLLKKNWDFLSLLYCFFAIDTLMLGEKCWAKACALKAVMILFEVISRLKVNFIKCMLMG